VLPRTQHGRLRRGPSDIPAAALRVGDGGGHAAAFVVADGRSLRAARGHPAPRARRVGRRADDTVGAHEAIRARGLRPAPLAPGRQALADPLSARGAHAAERPLRSAARLPIRPRLGAKPTKPVGASATAAAALKIAHAGEAVAEGAAGEAAEGRPIEAGERGQRLADRCRQFACASARLGVDRGCPGQRGELRAGEGEAFAALGTVTKRERASPGVVPSAQRIAKLELVAVGVGERGAGAGRGGGARSATGGGFVAIENELAPGTAGADGDGRRRSESEGEETTRGPQHEGGRIHGRPSSSIKLCLDPIGQRQAFLTSQNPLLLDY
jgi:hypothetical protein